MTPQRPRSDRKPAGSRSPSKRSLSNWARTRPRWPGHVHELAPGLQQLLGVGAVTGAILGTAYSHQGSVRNEAAFAAWQARRGCGHRLNRHGARQLNRALDVIARVRLSCDPTTRDYLARLLTEGKSKREIPRSLKRYIARRLFRQLSVVMA